MFDRLTEKMDGTDLNILGIYLVGKAEVNDKGVTIDSETFPWSETVKNKVGNGTHDLRIELAGEWDKSNGSKRSSFKVNDVKALDLKEGYIINKEKGAFDVRE